MFGIWKMKMKIEIQIEIKMGKGVQGEKDMLKLTAAAVFYFKFVQ